MPRFAWFVVAFLLGAVLDLGTKEAAFAALPHTGSSYPVSSWFAFTRAMNPGAAFGMFRGQQVFFMVVTVVAFVGVPYLVHTCPPRARLVPALLGLVLAGVFGNFWDRASFGMVRDFLDVHTPPTGALHDLCMRLFGTNVWPTFNVADVFITCGSVLMVIVVGRDEAAAAPGAPAEDDAKGVTAPPA